MARYRTPVGAGCQHLATTQLAKVRAPCRSQLLALFLARAFSIDVCSALGMETSDGLQGGEPRGLRPVLSGRANPRLSRPRLPVA